LLTLAARRAEGTARLPEWENARKKHNNNGRDFP